MSQEIVYTSSPQGLKLGSRGFCTVASTPGMASSLAERLESLSGYRHLYPPQDPQARLNPIAWSHLLLTVGGRRYHVLSRIADAGLDYSQRSNKLAHHVALDTNELPPGGPAWCLAQNQFMLTAWNEPPRLLNSGRVPPRGEQPTAVCTAWQRITGDAGWAGVLAQTAEVKRDAYLLFSPGMDLLPLLVEAQSLLPPARRWEVSFSTYVTRLPPGVECRWRCVVADTDEALVAKRTPGATVIDLTQPLGRAPDGPLVAAARTGQITFPALPRPVEAAPLTATQRRPLAGIDTTPDADLLSDGDYRLADDRTIPGPPPPVQLKMGSAPAASGRARRLTLLIGGVLGLLVLIGGGIAATKYIGRALASLPSKIADSITDPELEQQRTAAQDALQKWEDAKAEFEKAYGNATLKTLIATVDDTNASTNDMATQIENAKLPEKQEAVKPQLDAYRTAQRDSEAFLSDKESPVKANFRELGKSLRENLHRSKESLASVVKNAASTGEQTEKLRKQLADSLSALERQQAIAAKLAAAKGALQEQEQKLKSENHKSLASLRTEIEGAVRDATTVFAQLDEWASKSSEQGKRIKVLVEKTPRPSESKDAKSALEQYDALAKKLSDGALQELAKANSPSTETNITQFFAGKKDYQIGVGFPLGNKPSEISTNTNNPEGRLFEVPDAIAARFDLRNIKEVQDLNIVKARGDAKAWKVVKGISGSIAGTRTLGTFTLANGYLTWRWETGVHDALHNVFLTIRVGDKTHDIRLLTRIGQVEDAPLILAQDGDKLWKLGSHQIELESTDGIAIEVHGVDFKLPVDGYRFVVDTVKPNATELASHIRFKKDSDRLPRFSLTIAFSRQPAETEWKLQAQPLRVLSVSTDNANVPIKTNQKSYVPLLGAKLHRDLLQPESPKKKLSTLIRQIELNIDAIDKQIDIASKEKDEKKRSDRLNVLNNTKSIGIQELSIRRGHSQEVFPDELLKAIESNPQDFVDNFASSIKIHASVVRKQEGKPPLTIAQFGAVDVSKPDESKPMPAPEKAAQNK